MKAALRCKEHFQGDRCRKGNHHHSAFSDKPDSLHVGNWTAWTGSGDSKVVKLKMEPEAPRRNRHVNRFIRAFCSKKVNVNLISRGGQKTATALLTESLKYLRGGR